MSCTYIYAYHYVQTFCSNQELTKVDIQFTDSYTYVAINLIFIIYQSQTNMCTCIIAIAIRTHKAQEEEMTLIN